jgi:hypothetical protein
MQEIGGPMFNDTKESARLWVQIILWVVIGSIVFGGCHLVALKAWPIYRGLWFEGMRSGNEYISTQESMLYTMMQDYEDLEVQKATASDPDVITAIEGQQLAILDRMKRGVGTIEGHVPSDIARFLAQH